MQPHVLYLILCDNAQSDPNNYHRINVFGLLTSIQSRAVPPFPVVRPLFCALVVMTGGQGTGELLVRVSRDQTGDIIFNTRPRQVRFVGDPQAVVGMLFHLQNCCFPAAGLYWVEVVYQGSVLARQQLSLKT
jgi:hypothetical protein